MEEKRNEFKPNYLTIPIALFEDQRISPMGRDLYFFIEGLDNEFGCVASNGYLAAMMNSSKVTISQEISKLKKCGYIKDVSADEENRVLKVDREYVASQQEQAIKSFSKRYREYLAFTKSPIKQILNIYNKENNKRINKISSKEDISSGQAAATPVRPGRLNIEREDEWKDLNKPPFIQDKPVHIPTTIQPTIDLWNRYRPDKKVSLETVKPHIAQFIIQQIRALNSGSFINGIVPNSIYYKFKDKVFTLEEQEKCFIQLKTIIEDRDNRGISEERRQEYYKMPLNEFLYRKWPKVYKHPFLDVFMRIPESIPDPNPQITGYMRNWYKRIKRGGLNVGFSVEAENDLRKGAVETIAFYEKFGKKMRMVNSPLDLAKETCNAIDDFYEDKKFISTKTFWKEKTWQDIVPQWLNAQAVTGEE